MFCFTELLNAFLLSAFTCHLQTNYYAGNKRNKTQIKNNQHLQD